MSSALTLTFARFVLETDDVPADVLLAVQDALIDTLACGLAGVREPCTGIAVSCIEGDAGIATAWGRKATMSAANAAFVNGIAGHALDFDDTLASMRGHSSVTTVPVALAMGETLGASGREVLAALALGLEVAGKLGRAFGHGHYLRGWHSTATIGAFAAAAVAGRLLRHDPQTLCHAWGLAAAQSAGLVRNFGTMAKPFQAGHAARAGILAARYASAGMTADSGIFDGNGGFLATYAADGAPLGDVISGLGQRWEAIDPGLNVKRWPCCYCCHRAIGGLLEMLDEHRIGREDVTEVVVGFPPGADEPLIYRDPGTGLEAKFSIEYPIAAVLLDGDLTLRSFTDESVRRPRVREMMRRVRRVRVNDSGTYSGTIGYTDLEVRTSAGSWSRRISKAPGSREWPVDRAARRAKFIDCVSSALGAERAADLLGIAERTLVLPLVRELTQRTGAHDAGTTETRAKAMADPADTDRSRGATS